MRFLVGYKINSEYQNEEISFNAEEILYIYRWDRVPDRYMIVELKNGESFEIHDWESTKWLLKRISNDELKGEGK